MPKEEAPQWFSPTRLLDGPGCSPVVARFCLRERPRIGFCCRAERPCESGLLDLRLTMARSVQFTGLFGRLRRHRGPPDRAVGVGRPGHGVGDRVADDLVVGLGVGLGDGLEQQRHPLPRPPPLPGVQERLRRPRPLDSSARRRARRAPRRARRHASGRAPGWARAGREAWQQEPWGSSPYPLPAGAPRRRPRPSRRSAALKPKIAHA